MPDETIDLEVIPATFSPGYCPENNQTLANDIAAGMRVLFPSELGTVIVSPNEPTVEQRTSVWNRLDPISGIITGTFTWSPLFGTWLSPHPIPPSGSMRQLWVGTLNALETYDGGEAGTISQTTGPFGLPTFCLLIRGHWASGQSLFCRLQITPFWMMPYPARRKLAACTSSLELLASIDEAHERSTYTGRVQSRSCRRNSRWGLRHLTAIFAVRE